MIKVRAATLGFPDLLMTHGGYQMKPELPFTLGMEFAGEVVECGDDVTDFAVNDRVVSGGFLGGTGGFAEFALGQAATARKIPDNLDFAQAAALGTAYLTAYVGLVRCGALQKGEYLLVHGAAGGVGLAALDLGRHLGAKLIATASSSEKCRSSQCSNNALRLQARGTHSTNNSDTTLHTLHTSFAEEVS